MTSSVKTTPNTVIREDPNAFLQRVRHAEKATTKSKDTKPWKWKGRRRR
jgi:hypothetical protein